MSTASYRDGIQKAYEGELVGANLYRALASRSDDADRRAKLNAIADVESLTHGRLKHIAVRFGIISIESNWRAIVERRANEMASLSWSEFIATALRDWPPYVERFQALKPMAPACDEPSIQFLVDHELALVEFAHLEHAAMGTSASLQVLRKFLENA